MLSEKSTSWVLLPQPLVRFLSIVLTLTIVGGDPASASAFSGFIRENYSTNLKNLSIPSRLGAITDRWVPADAGAKAPTVILIQDLHANVQVQENIASLIEHLYHRLHIGGVYMEAAFGVCDTSVLRSIPNRRRLRKLTDKLVARAYLSGDDLAAVRLGEGTLSPIRLEGVDDPMLYLANVQAFRDLVMQGKEAAHEWKEIRDLLQPGAFPQLRRHLELTEKMLALKLLDDEWIQYKEHKDLTPRGDKALAFAVAAAERFYVAAEARNAAIASNLRHQLPQLNRPAVLVTGGFHTASIAHDLKTHGIGFAVVTPVVEKLDHEELYVKSMIEPPHETVRALNPLMVGKARELTSLAAQLKLPIKSWIMKWFTIVPRERMRAEPGPLNPAKSKTYFQRIAEWLAQPSLPQAPPQAAARTVRPQWVRSTAAVFAWLQRFQRAEDIAAVAAEQQGIYWNQILGQVYPSKLDANYAITEGRRRLGRQEGIAGYVRRDLFAHLHDQLDSARVQQTEAGDWIIVQGKTTNVNAAPAVELTPLEAPTGFAWVRQNGMLIASAATAAFLALAAGAVASPSSAANLSAFLFNAGWIAASAGAFAAGLKIIFSSVWVSNRRMPNRWQFARLGTVIASVSALFLIAGCMDNGVQQNPVQPPAATTPVVQDSLFQIPSVKLKSGTDAKANLDSARAHAAEARQSAEQDERALRQAQQAVRDLQTDLSEMKSPIRLQADSLKQVAARLAAIDPAQIVNALDRMDKDSALTVQGVRERIQGLKTYAAQLVKFKTAVDSLQIVLANGRELSEQEMVDFRALVQETVLLSDNFGEGLADWNSVYDYLQSLELTTISSAELADLQANIRLIGADQLIQAYWQSIHNARNPDAAQQARDFERQRLETKIKQTAKALETHLVALREADRQVILAELTSIERDSIGVVLRHLSAQQQSLSNQRNAWGDALRATHSAIAAVVDAQNVLRESLDPAAHQAALSKALSAWREMKTQQKAFDAQQNDSLASQLGILPTDPEILKGIVLATGGTAYDAFVEFADALKAQNLYTDDSQALRLWYGFAARSAVSLSDAGKLESVLRLAQELTRSPISLATQADRANEGAADIQRNAVAARNSIADMQVKISRLQKDINQTTQRGEQAQARAVTNNLVQSTDSLINPDSADVNSLLGALGGLEPGTIPFRKAEEGQNFLKAARALQGVLVEISARNAGTDITPAQADELSAAYHEFINYFLDVVDVRAVDLTQQKNPAGAATYRVMQEAALFGFKYYAGVVQAQLDNAKISRDEQALHWSELLRGISPVDAARLQTFRDQIVPKAGIYPGMHVDKASDLWSLNEILMMFSTVYGVINAPQDYAAMTAKSAYIFNDVVQVTPQEQVGKVPFETRLSKDKFIYAKAPGTIRIILGTGNAILNAQGAANMVLAIANAAPQDVGFYAATLDKDLFGGLDWQVIPAETPQPGYVYFGMPDGRMMRAEKRVTARDAANTDRWLQSDVDVQGRFVTIVDGKQFVWVAGKDQLSIAARVKTLGKTALAAGLVYDFVKPAINGDLSHDLKVKVGWFSRSMGAVRLLGTFERLLAIPDYITAKRAFAGKEGRWIPAGKIEFVGSVQTTNKSGQPVTVVFDKSGSMFYERIDSDGARIYEDENGTPLYKTKNSVGRTLFDIVQLKRIPFVNGTKTSQVFQVSVNAVIEGLNKQTGQYRQRRSNASPVKINADSTGLTTLAAGDTVRWTLAKEPLSVKFNGEQRLVLPFYQTQANGERGDFQGVIVVAGTATGWTLPFVADQAGEISREAIYSFIGSQSQKVQSYLGTLSATWLSMDPTVQGPSAFAAFKSGKWELDPFSGENRLKEDSTGRIIATQWKDETGEYFWNGENVGGETLVWRTADAKGNLVYSVASAPAQGLARTAKLLDSTSVGQWQASAPHSARGSSGATRYSINGAPQAQAYRDASGTWHIEVKKGAVQINGQRLTKGDWRFDPSVAALESTKREFENEPLMVEQEVPVAIDLDSLRGGSREIRAGPNGPETYYYFGSGKVQGSFRKRTIDGKTQISYLSLSSAGQRYLSENLNGSAPEYWQPMFVLPGADQMQWSRVEIPAGLPLTAIGAERASGTDNVFLRVRATDGRTYFFQRARVQKEEVASPQTVREGMEQLQFGSRFGTVLPVSKTIADVRNQFATKEMLPASRTGRTVIYGGVEVLPWSNPGEPGDKPGSHVYSLLEVMRDGVFEGTPVRKGQVIVLQTGLRGIATEDSLHKLPHPIVRRDIRSLEMVRESEGANIREGVAGADRLPAYLGQTVSGVEGTWIEAKDEKGRWTPTYFAITKGNTSFAAGQVLVLIPTEASSRRYEEFHTRANKPVYAKALVSEATLQRTYAEAAAEQGYEGDRLVSEAGASSRFQIPGTNVVGTPLFSKRGNSQAPSVLIVTQTGTLDDPFLGKIEVRAGDVLILQLPLKYQERIQSAATSGGFAFVPRDTTGLLSAELGFNRHGPSAEEAHTNSSGFTPLQTQQTSVMVLMHFDGRIEGIRGSVKQDAFSGIVRFKDLTPAQQQSILALGFPMSGNALVKLDSSGKPIASVLLGASAKAFAATQLSGDGYLAARPGTGRVVLNRADGQGTITADLSGWVAIGNQSGAIPLDVVQANAAHTNGTDDKAGWSLYDARDPKHLKPVAAVIFGEEAALRALNNPGIDSRMKGAAAAFYPVDSAAKPRALSQAQVDSMGSRIVTIVQDTDKAWVPAVWSPQTQKWHRLMLDRRRFRLVPSAQPFTHAIKETGSTAAHGLVDVRTGVITGVVNFTAKPSDKVENAQTDAENYLQDHSLAEFRAAARQEEWGPFPYPDRLKVVDLKADSSPKVAINLVDGTSEVTFQNAVTGEIFNEIYFGSVLRSRARSRMVEGKLTPIDSIFYASDPSGLHGERAPREKWEFFNNKWTKTETYTIGANQKWSYPTSIAGVSHDSILGDRVVTYSADGQTVLRTEFKDLQGRNIWTEQGATRAISVYRPATLPSSSGPLEVNIDGEHEIATETHTFKYNDLSKSFEPWRESAVLGWRDDNSLLLLETGPGGVAAGRGRLSNLDSLTASNADIWFRNELSQWVRTNNWRGPEALTLYNAAGQPVASRGIDEGGLLYTYSVAQGNELTSRSFDKNPRLQILDHNQGVRLRTIADYLNPVRTASLGAPQLLTDSLISRKDPKNVYIPKRVRVLSLNNPDQTVVEAVVWYRQSDGLIAKVERRQIRPGQDWSAWSSTYPKDAKVLYTGSRGEEVREPETAAGDSKLTQIWYKDRLYAVTGETKYDEFSQKETWIHDTDSDQEQPVPVVSIVTNGGLFGYLHLTARDGEDAVYHYNADGQASLSAFVGGEQVAVAYGDHAVFPFEGSAARDYSTLPNALARTGIRIGGFAPLAPQADPKLGPLIQNGRIVYPSISLADRANAVKTAPLLPSGFLANRTPWSSVSGYGLTPTSRADLVTKILEKRVVETEASAEIDRPHPLVFTAPGTEGELYVETVREAAIAEFLAKSGHMDEARAILRFYMTQTNNGQKAVRGFYSASTYEPVYFNPAARTTEVSKATSEDQIALATTALKVARWTGDRAIYNFGWQLLARAMEYADPVAGGFAVTVPDVAHNLGPLGFTSPARRAYVTRANIAALHLLELASESMDAVPPTSGLIDAAKVRQALTSQRNWLTTNVVSAWQTQRWIPAAFEEQRTVGQQSSDNANVPGILVPSGRSAADAWVAFAEVAPSLGIDSSGVAQVLDNLFRVHGVRYATTEHSPRVGLDFSPPFGRTEGDVVDTRSTTELLRVSNKLGYQPAQTWARSAVGSLQNRDATISDEVGVQVGEVGQNGVETGLSYRILPSKGSISPAAAASLAEALYPVQDPALVPMGPEIVTSNVATESSRSVRFWAFFGVVLFPLFVTFYGFLTQLWYRFGMQKAKQEMLDDPTADDTVIPGYVLRAAQERWARNILWREESKSNPHFLRVNGPVEAGFPFSLKWIMIEVMAWRAKALEQEGLSESEIQTRLLSEDLWLESVDELALAAGFVFRRDEFLGINSEDQTAIYARMEMYLYELRERLREARSRGAEGWEDFPSILQDFEVRQRTSPLVKNSASRDRAMEVIQAPATAHNDVYTYIEVQSALGMEPDRFNDFLASFRDFKTAEDLSAPHPYVIELISLLPMLIFGVLLTVAYRVSELGVGSIFTLIQNAGANTVIPDALVWGLVVLGATYLVGTVMKVRGGLGRLTNGRNGTMRVSRFRDRMEIGLRWSMVLRATSLLVSSYLILAYVPAASFPLWIMKMLVASLIALEGAGYIGIPWRDLGVGRNRSILVMTLKYYLRPAAHWGGIAAFVNYFILNGLSLLFMGIMGNIAYPWFEGQHLTDRRIAIEVGSVIFLLSVYLLRYGLSVLMSVLASFGVQFPKKFFVLAGASSLVILERAFSLTSPTITWSITGVVAFLMVMQEIYKRYQEGREDKNRGNGALIGTRTAFAYIGGDALGSPAFVKSRTKTGAEKLLEPSIDAFIERWERETALGSQGQESLRAKYDIPKDESQWRGLAFAWHSFYDPRVRERYNLPPSIEVAKVRGYLEALYDAEREAKVTLFSLRQLEDPNLGASPYADLQIFPVGKNADGKKRTIEDVRTGFVLRRWLTDMTATSGQSQNTGQNLAEIAEALMKAGRASEAYFVLMSNKFNDDSSLPNQETGDADSELGQRTQLIRLIEYITEGQSTGKVIYDWTPIASKSATAAGMDALYEMLPNVDTIGILDRNAVAGDAQALIKDFERIRDNPAINAIIPTRATPNVKTDLGDASRMVEEGHASALIGTMFLGGESGEAIGTGWMNFVRTNYWATINQLADPRSSTVPMTSRLRRDRYGKGTGSLWNRIYRYLWDTSFGQIGFNSVASGISEDIASVQQQGHSSVALGVVPEYRVGGTVVDKLRETYAHSAWASAPPRWAGGTLDLEGDPIQQKTVNFGPFSVTTREVRRSSGRFFGSVPFAFINLALLPISIRFGVSPFRGIDLIFWAIGTFFSQVLRLHGLVAMMRNSGFSEVTGIVGAAVTGWITHDPVMAMFAYLVFGFITSFGRWIPNQIRDMFLFAMQPIAHLKGQWQRFTYQFHISGSGDPATGRSDEKLNYLSIILATMWPTEWGRNPYAVYLSYVRSTWPNDADKPALHKRWIGFVGAYLHFIKYEPAKGEKPLFVPRVIAPEQIRLGVPGLSQLNVVNRTLRRINTFWVRWVEAYIPGSITFWSFAVGLSLFSLDLWAIQSLDILVPFMTYPALMFASGLIIGQFVSNVRPGRHLGPFDWVPKYLGGLAGLSILFGWYWRVGVLPGTGWVVLPAGLLLGFGPHLANLLFLHRRGWKENHAALTYANRFGSDLAKSTLRTVFSLIWFFVVPVSGDVGYTVAGQTGHLPGPDLLQAMVVGVIILAAFSAVSSLVLKIQMRWYQEWARPLPLIGGPSSNLSLHQRFEANRHRISHANRSILHGLFSRVDIYMDQQAPEFAKNFLQKIQDILDEELSQDRGDVDDGPPVPRPDVSPVVLESLAPADPVDPPATSPVEPVRATPEFFTVIEPRNSERAQPQPDSVPTRTSAPEIPAPTVTPVVTPPEVSVNREAELDREGVEQLRAYTRQFEEIVASDPGSRDGMYEVVRSFLRSLEADAIRFGGTADWELHAQKIQMAIERGDKMQHGKRTPIGKFLREVKAWIAIQSGDQPIVRETWSQRLSKWLPWVGRLGSAQVLILPLGLTAPQKAVYYGVMLASVIAFALKARSRAGKNSKPKVDDALLKMQTAA